MYFHVNLNFSKFNKKVHLLVSEQYTIHMVEILDVENLLAKIGPKRRVSISVQFIRS